MEINEEQKDFSRKVNVDKALKKSIKSCVLIIISLLSYVYPFLWGEFDFGVIFEAISFILLLIAIVFMKKYDEVTSKIFSILAIIPVGWILIYDFITYVTAITDEWEFITFGYDYYCVELILIVYIVILLAIIKDLSKAKDPITYKESTDWFYETYEGDKSKK